uniref:Uncharacterized protein n=1 Tax=Palpitomonas bilix TaxID=652834 RepID=A0A7S3CWE9_9EUKA|mmetsp:Transcript_10500/g.27497  ORF Transcript_10500/g.27497 Transcript_10500/m.27497 type:complete len:142 (+) Transcript_10500:201-626(+)
MHSSLFPSLSLLFFLSCLGVVAAQTDSYTYKCCTVPALPYVVTNTSELGCASICSGEVWYTSLSTCIIESVCENVERDYEQALTKLKKINNFEFSGFDASSVCKKALRRGICAYHFPVCLHDHEVESHLVCRDVSMGRRGK